LLINFDSIWNDFYRHFWSIFSISYVVYISLLLCVYWLWGGEVVEQLLNQIMSCFDVCLIFWDVMEAEIHLIRIVMWLIKSQRMMKKNKNFFDLMSSHFDRMFNILFKIDTRMSIRDLQQECRTQHRHKVMND
jgi:hypothetical protein